nr:inorganic phosphate transporter 1-4-like [Ipomoea batatas]
MGHVNKMAAIRSDQCSQRSRTETGRYTALVAKNAKQAASDMSKVMQVEIETKPEKSSQESAGNDFWLFSKQFLRRHGLHLLGTTTTWFLLYIAFYSQNLFQKAIFSAIGWIPKAETMNALEEVYGIAGAHTLIGLCSTMAGYLFTVAIDKIGRFAPQRIAMEFPDYEYHIRKFSLHRARG